MSGIERLFASSLQGLAPGLPDPGAAARDRLVFASGAGIAETRSPARGAGMGVDGEDFDQPLETRAEKARRPHGLASVGGEAPRRQPRRVRSEP